MNAYPARPTYSSLLHAWVSRAWLQIAYLAAKWFFRLCCRVHVAGIEHIPTHGGVVFVSNHVSVFDTLLLPYTVLETRKASIVWAPAKAELFQWRLMRALLPPLGVFPVRRGQHDRQAMRRMIQHMRTEAMMLFPEGTRSRDGHLQDGKRPVGKLIYAAQPVVLPTAIVGTNRILAHLQWPFRGRAPVSIRYGPPLDVRHYYAQPDTKDTAMAIVREVMHAIALQLEVATLDPRHASRAKLTGHV